MKPGEGLKPSGKAVRLDEISAAPFFYENWRNFLRIDRRIKRVLDI